MSNHKYSRYDSWQKVSLIELDTVGSARAFRSARHRSLALRRLQAEIEVDRNRRRPDIAARIGTVVERSYHRVWEKGKYYKPRHAAW